ncbi:MAG TPA: endonuclease/exonuclease/phosphatase family protein [Ktedonobacterales bacterium]
MPLRVMTYNIWDGGGDRLERIRSVIQEVRPGVLALEEAGEQPRMEQLAGELGMTLAYGAFNSKWHLAWLSRLPIAARASYTFPVLAKSLEQIEVSFNGTPLQLFAAHLGSGRSTKGEEERAGEVRAIIEVMAEQRMKTPVAQQVLVGDFNTLAPKAVEPPHDGLSLEGRTRAKMIYGVPRLAIPLVLEANLFDCYQIQHPGEQGYTFKSWEPLARFDYIFAGEQLAKRLRGCDHVTGGETAKASDHLPVWAEFS